MVAPIDIINRALVILGEQPIMTLDQPCKPARIASILYEAVLQSELAGHPWHFAKKRQRLAQEEPGECVEGYFYRLPSDWLHSLAVLDTDGEEDKGAVHEGQGIRTSHSSGILLSYIAKLDDPRAYPVLFQDVLVLRLASDMAESLTQSTAKRESLYRSYQEALRKAKQANAWMASPAAIPESNWVSARRY